MITLCNTQKYKTPIITDEGLLFWWAHQDLNLGPKDYESSALTNWAIGPLVFGSIFLEEGLEFVATTWVTHLA